MSDSNSFSEQFRPKRPVGLYGKYQRELAENLLNRVDSGKYPQVVLFCGPTGIGKTTIAYMYAAKILGQYTFDEKDVFVVNCGDDTGVDGVREIISNLHKGNLWNDKSVFYLDEFHNLTKNAQEALLKALEPVPDHVIFMASTTNPEKIIKTVRDRFKVFTLTIPSKEEFVRLGTDVFKVLKKPLDLDLINQIYDTCQGSVRLFQDNLQEAIEGVYKPVKMNIDDPESLFNMLFFQSVKLPVLFSAVEQNPKYTDVTLGLCGYAIKVLSNSSSKPETFRRAQIILHVMGEGLSWGPFEKASFYQKLLRIYVELSGK